MSPGCGLSRERRVRKRGKRYKRLFDHRHLTAVLLIEHPLRNDELISAGKQQLNLVSRLTGE
jgi:hypothetical protein